MQFSLQLILPTVPMRVKKIEVKIMHFYINLSKALATDCTHRATTASSWGLCEHRNHANCLAIPFPGRALRDHRYQCSLQARSLSSGMGGD